MGAVERHQSHRRDRSRAQGVGQGGLATLGMHLQVKLGMLLAMQGMRPEKQGKQPAMPGTPETCGLASEERLKSRDSAREVARLPLQLGGQQTRCNLQRSASAGAADC